MNQKEFVNVLLIAIVVALVGAGIYVVSTRQPAPPTSTPSLSPTTTTTTTITPTPTPTTTSTSQKNTVEAKQQPAWTWENLGCGSSVPCSYRVCSTTNPENCYSCRGKYDKLSPEGEKLPEENEDPLTTNNFICDIGFNDQIDEFSCRVTCSGAPPPPNLEQDCYALPTQEQCIAYRSTEFPSFRCEWQPTNYPCLLP